MTYKDHGEIALIFRKHLAAVDGIELPIKDESSHSYHAITAMLDDVANYCYHDNPKFDRDKFYIAAGIGLV
jgi:hypothetical protein